ncbi:hypothetical protein PRIPAC_83065 [Pristionchus pacificus]|uniref:Uncharacterized protein n=1 Tax=Pristionchus pacificus TaxID=54126 RepID=A0A2A6BW08_PRIPA|nr:hypothetical protein PRIPAC_83065 [Pristionchus pacificus]|eukprot:PDM69951.1 hypothetical protein PRIPAC_49163 [Pristionchus pacificus]
MRFILFLLVGTALGDFSAQKLRSRFGDQVNISAAESIIAEEALKLGVEEWDHLEQCTVRLTHFWSAIYLTPEKSHMVRRRDDHWNPIELTASLTADFTAVKSAVKQTHVFQTTVVEISQLHADKTKEERRELVAAGWYDRKMEYVDQLYSNIPEESMNNFEKVFFASELARGSPQFLKWSLRRSMIHSNGRNNLFCTMNISNMNAIELK